LIIHNKELYALKRVGKLTVNNPKRIEHAKNEKHTLLKMKGNPFVVKLERTFSDPSNLCYLLEYLPGNDLFWVLANEMHLKLGAAKDKSWVKFFAAEIIEVVD